MLLLTQNPVPSSCSSHAFHFIYKLTFHIARALDWKDHHISDLIMLDYWCSLKTSLVVDKERALESHVVELPPSGAMFVLRRSTFDPLSVSALDLPARTGSQSQPQKS
jgi:hypothetical protein